MTKTQQNQAIRAIQKFATITCYFIDPNPNNPVGYCAMGAMAKATGVSDAILHLANNNGGMQVWHYVCQRVFNQYGMTERQCDYLVALNNKEPNTIVRQQKLTEYLLSLPLEPEPVK